MNKLRGNFDKVNSLILVLSTMSRGLADLQIKRRTLLGTAAQALDAPPPALGPGPGQGQGHPLSAIPPNMRPVHHAPVCPSSTGPSIGPVCGHD